SAGRFSSRSARRLHALRFASLAPRCQVRRCCPTLVNRCQSALFLTTLAIGRLTGPRTQTSNPLQDLSARARWNLSLSSDLFHAIDSPSTDEYVGRSPEGTRAGLGAARRSARQIDSPSTDEYVGRSPEGTRAGLGAARRSARQIDSPSADEYTSVGPPRGRGPAWERPGARPAGPPKKTPAEAGVFSEPQAQLI